MSYPVWAVNEICRLIREQEPEHPGEDWRDESTDSHLAAAQRHLQAHQAGKTLDQSGHSHLIHLAARTLMAAETARPKPQNKTPNGRATY